MDKEALNKKISKKKVKSKKLKEDLETKEKDIETN